MWQQWYEMHAPALDRQAFLDAVMAGLHGAPKTLPAKYLSATAGVHATLQRAEAALLREHAAAIARLDAKVIVSCAEFAALEPEEAQRHLRGVRGKAVRLTVDLKKDPAVFLHEYNDDDTAALNLGLLDRMRAELAADLDRAAFRHYAFYAPAASRVEMHLVSLRDQPLYVGGQGFQLSEGETLRTEVAYKYTARELATLARSAGLQLSELFTDATGSMAIAYLTPFRPSLLLAMDA